MPKNPETYSFFDAAKIEQARWLIAAASSHDTGEPVPLHLPPVPYDSIIPSQMIMNGLLHAAQRASELGLNPEKEQDSQILSFAQELIEAQAKPSEPTIREIGGLAIRPPEGFLEARRKVQRKAGQMAAALVFVSLP